MISYFRDCHVDVLNYFLPCILYIWSIYRYSLHISYLNVVSVYYKWDYSFVYSKVTNLKQTALIWGLCKQGLYTDNRQLCTVYSSVYSTGSSLRCTVQFTASGSFLQCTVQWTAQTVVYSVQFSVQHRQLSTVYSLMNSTDNCIQCTVQYAAQTIVYSVQFSVQHRQLYS